MKIFHRWTVQASGVKQCLKCEELARGLKYEEGGYMSLTPPVCTVMASLVMYQPTACKRVAMFARAFIQRNRPLLLHIGKKIAARIR